VKKINVKDIAEFAWVSPKGTFRGAGLEVSEALGREPRSTDLRKRHPFDVEILRVEPGHRPYPFHSHSAQWEFYYVLSGRGAMRHDNGSSAIVAGDAMLFEPGEAHQVINDGAQDLTIIIVADNPFGESCHYPDSGKWSVPIPQRRLLRGEALDYFDGEE